MYCPQCHIPPLILKKTHALTARLKPNAKLIYSRILVLGTCVRDPSAVPAPDAAAFATCVAEKAKNRNRKVPMNSPTIATKWFRGLLGRKPMKGTRSSFLVLSPLRGLRPGMFRPLIEGTLMFIVPARWGGGFFDPIFSAEGFVVAARVGGIGSCGMVLRG